jgi:HlyD family secretion protein
MRVGLCLTLLFVGGLLAWCGRAQTTSPAQEGKEVVLEVAGKTRPAPGRKGVVAPAVLHPVVEVMASAGDRVKKDQPLVKLDDDEPQADLRAKKAALAELGATLARLKAEPRQHEVEEAEAALETYRVAAKAARQFVERLEPAWANGSIPDQRFHDAKADAAKAEADVRAAEARLKRLQRRPFQFEVAELEARIAGAKEAIKAAEAELEHYTVRAPIDGVITWLDVNPGTVSRPGTSVWGEVIDLSEIDVECGLTPEQAERVTVGQKAEVSPDGRPGVWSGEVVFVGVAADAQTGRVPVKVRVKEARGRVRCHIEAKVRFGGQTAGGPAKDAPPIH